MINEDVVNYIIEHQGDCCDNERCKACPFLQECAEYMMGDYKRPSMSAKAKRVEKALEILTRFLMDDYEQDD